MKDTCTQLLDDQENARNTARRPTFCFISPLPFKALDVLRTATWRSGLVSPVSPLVDLLCPTLALDKGEAPGAKNCPSICSHPGKAPSYPVQVPLPLESSCRS